MLQIMHLPLKKKKTNKTKPKKKKQKKTTGTSHNKDFGMNGKAVELG